MKINFRQFTAQSYAKVEQKRSRRGAAGPHDFSPGPPAPPPSQFW